MYAIRAVVTAAFGQPEEAALVDALHADGDAAISLVAIEAGAVVGHVLLSPMTAPFRALGLAPLAVLPDRHRRGIGAALVCAAIAAANAQGWEGIFLLGDPGYYARFGFSAAAACGFSSPYAGPHFQLRPLADPLPSQGAAAYASAFDWF